MPTCATYRPQQSLTAFQSWSVGVCNAGIRCTHAYTYNTTQVAYTQSYSTSNYTAPQKLGWMSTSNQLLTGAPMPELELSHSADGHLLDVRSATGTEVRYTLYPSGQRAVAEHTEGGRPVLVRLHLGDAEVDIDPRTDRRTHRLRVQSPTGVATVIESDGQSSTASYIHTDFQGSWTLLTDADGQAITRQAFDAWGRPRNPYTWAPLPEGQGICMPGQRGYTGHEHLPALGLIHMNGRAYAPGLQRFLSPDPVLQAPANAQSHNRYAYCLNNPLRYTDPSGYIHAPAVPRWPEGYEPPEYDDDSWGGSSGWARAMTPGMTYGWISWLPASARGPAFYAYFGSDGSRNAPPSSHFDYVYGAGGERGRVEWKYRWESKPGKIQADGGIEVIGYKEWYAEWTPAGELIQSSTLSKTINGTAWLWGAANAASSLKKYGDVGSLAAQRIIGNVCNALNIAATVSNGYDLYMNRDRITNGDIAKFGVDAGITAITAIIMGLSLSNPVGWVLTGIQVANTVGVFDPIYEYINVHYPRKNNNQNIKNRIP